MAVTKETKTNIVKKFKKGELDTGSPEVQVALLTAKIQDLTTHFASNKKDHHGRRGLVTMVNKRRKLLDYLHRKDAKRYQELIKALEIRK